MNSYYNITDNSGIVMRFLVNGFFFFLLVKLVIRWQTFVLILRKNGTIALTWQKKWVKKSVQFTCNTPHHWKSNKKLATFLNTLFTHFLVLLADEIEEAQYNIQLCNHLCRWPIRTGQQHPRRWYFQLREWQKILACQTNY